MIEGLRQFRMEDLEAMLPLIEVCEEEDQTGSVPTLEQLRHQASMPGLDAEKHLFVLPDASGALIAFGGAVPLPGEGTITLYTMLMVHPAHRAVLLDALLEIIEARATEWQAETQQAGVLQVSLLAKQAPYLELYERHGFRTVRWFLELERDLEAPIEETPVPPDVVIRPMNLETDVEAYYLALNDSFRDHWNTPEFTLEQVRHMLQSPGARPELTLLAFGPNEEPAGICANSVRTEHNKQHNVREGMVSTLGVRRAFRRNGLARALLTRSLRLLHDEDLTSAVLYVDADSPTGATRLYESVGFIERKRSMVLQKPVGVTP
ncbi:MAG TPA: GNAT family N-acetyltransferase [Chthonomonadaceae bacterium]|nr:GNAT family N-acetyltransferase [Chthonomonadaceae bacterium]